MASSKETYCLCGQPYNVGQFMIECDCCREWFHGSCVDVKIYQSDDIDKYHCPKCAQIYGPSVLKIPTNNHRSDRYELGAEARPAQAGSPAWVRALAARPPRPHPNALQRLRGDQFTEEFVRDNGFTKPIMFSSIDGLDMKVPNGTTFSARSVLRYCGAQFEVEVIDVRKQSTLRMPLGEFVEYFETPPETRSEKVLNVISLEFSETNMSPLVEPPATMRALDWSIRAWPAVSTEPPRPSISKYCLMSAAQAYTDWHVDFGGTAVWYHVLRGGKTFFLAPPTSTNLALYQQWSASNNQNERFFGDMLEWYGTAEVSAGETLVIPSGWIHAVLTPKDSLVLGGNLLHSYAIEMQLQIYEIERRVETPVMFRYPLFEGMHWYAGAHLLTLLRRHNEESQDEDFIISEQDVHSGPMELPPLLLRGIKILANALKEWHALKSSDTAKRDNVPKCLNSGQLVRELCKELRTIEKRSSVCVKDKDCKTKHNVSPNKSHAKKPTQKKLLKLTLPKPIMHMQHNINGEYPEEKIYEKPYLDSKEILYQDPRYLTQDVKYSEGLEEAKTFVIDGKELVMTDDKSYIYSNYEEPLPPVYAQESNGFVETTEKKNGSSVLRIKLNNSPSSSRDAPPPYSLPEHSILKSHLTGRPPPAPGPDRAIERGKLQQWTISKKELGEYQEEHILFTNDNLNQNVQADLAYGPGMYSAEDIQPDYQYVVDAKQPSYPAYSYLLPREPYPAFIEAEPLEQQTAGGYGQTATAAAAVNGYQHELPSYDAAIAQQYAATTTNNYVSSPSPAVPPAVTVTVTATTVTTATPVRRSERAARRRVSPTYDYEDGDLYIDEAPPPRRRHYRQHASSNSSSYRQPRPAPVNGIESLIQASVLAEEEPPSATEDAAVAGMLSIGEQRYTAPQRTFGLATDTVHATTSTQNSTKGGATNKRNRKPQLSADEEEPDDLDDVIKEVHRDEEYVYPSLEMSSDEDEEWTSSKRLRNRSRNDSRSKSEKDSPWSPRGRLGRLVPRVRSGRAGVRREAVRAALSHAAHAHHTHHTHHAQHAAHAHHAPHHSQAHNAKRAVLANKSRRPPPPPPPPRNNKSDTRLKKGMKTAKQRLGKILKIHKMIY